MELITIFIFAVWVAQFIWIVLDAKNQTNSNRVWKLKENHWSYEYRG